MAQYTNQQKIEDLSMRLNEPEYCLKARQEALKIMAELDMPQYDRMPTQDMNLVSADITPYFHESGNVYNFIDKTEQLLMVQEEEQTIIEQIPAKYQEQGVIFTDLMTAFTDHKELMEKYFMSVIKVDDNKLTAFHRAFLMNGVVLYIPKNVVIEEPVESLLMQEDTNSTFSKHILIIAEENSQCTYIEHLTSSTKATNPRNGNMFVEIIAKPGSKVVYSAIDESQENLNLFLERKAHVEKDATVDFAIGSMNRGKVLADFDVELVGDGSNSNQHIVAISTDKQCQMIDTKVNHYGKNSVGDIMQRGVVLKEGDLRFNGIGHIFPPGKNAKTTQESRLMMMTDKGRGDANPMLLIDHDEVVASHAASVGQLDVETIFYLMSRGLSEEQVIKLQTYAFLAPVMKAMPNKQMKDKLFVHLERALD